MSPGNSPHVTVNRRQLIRSMGTGLGLIALPDLLDATANPLAVKTPHFRPSAKHIIHIYLNGGPSQVDTWDYKPELNKQGGKRLPIRNLTTERETGVALASPFRFKQYGESGLWCSEIFAKTASQHADKICVIKMLVSEVSHTIDKFICSWIRSHLRPAFVARSLAPQAMIAKNKSP